jgi:signal transduction histidine kinase
MRLSRHHLSQLAGTLIPLAALWVPARIEAAELAEIANPISRIARLFSPQLVKVEDRVNWLDARVSTYAKHCEYPLRRNIGYRGGRTGSGNEDPSITLDLGEETPVDQIFLVPSQREFLEDTGIFPKRFTLEVSRRADFAMSTVIYRSGEVPFVTPDATPTLFNCSDIARYVRLTVQQGHRRESEDLFGLSELMVISRGEPVSFSAKVETVGALDIPGLWEPAALIDGRTPLGIWQNGASVGQSSGDVVIVEQENSITTWSLNLDRVSLVDRVVLFPYQVSRSFETSVFPESLVIEMVDENGGCETVAEWNNPLRGASHMTPLVIPLKGGPAKILRLKATRPWIMGDRQLHALSEIQVWSGSTNVAEGRPMTREFEGKSAPVTNLTDGLSSEQKIMPVGLWLSQLRERSQIERELASLRSYQGQLAANSELNATWGSAVILGLTFLIPVFIVERRRLMSKEQLDGIRKRIASDLHDDIGSNLGSISLIARTARKDLVRLQGPEEIALDLNEVETIARESSLAMRDIVWLLERRQDSIGDLVVRMRETAGRLLREMEFTVECDSTKTAAKLSLDAKRHLFLFYKEAIHNVLKHSKANRVAIRLWDEDDKLALEITDNGIGLPSDGRKKGPTAVNKLQDRAHVLDGLLQIVSAANDGTCIRLFVKRSHLTQHPALS